MWICSEAITEPWVSITRRRSAFLVACYLRKWFPTYCLNEDESRQSSPDSPESSSRLWKKRLSQLDYFSVIFHQAAFSLVCNVFLHSIFKFSKNPLFWRGKAKIFSGQAPTPLLQTPHQDPDQLRHCRPPTRGVFLGFCQTWTNCKRYLITSQSKVKRADTSDGLVAYPAFTQWWNAFRLLTKCFSPKSDLQRSIRCIRLLRLTLSCEVIRYRLVQVRKKS